MKLAILSETAVGERRVAVVPKTAGLLVQRGLEVAVQSAAGLGAFFSDDDYAEAGASIASDATGVVDGADIVIKIEPPDRSELDLLNEGQVLVCLLRPGANGELVGQLAEAGVTSFALDTVPRISRAQSMDVLSSQSTVAGYRAVVLAVSSLGTMTPMMMTAAGTLRPAGALVIGAGVAGLQAIATAKRLGAVVTAVDVRPVAREEVESLGAKFVPMEVDHSAQDPGGYATDLGEEFYQAEQEIIAPFSKKADFIISTALIPGRPAPVLITEQMVDDMKGGSVIVDLAAAAGGNCALSNPGQTTEHNGVTIHAPLNLPSDIPVDASEMFSSNVAAFINELLSDEGEISIDMENEIIKGTLVTHEGRSL
ncbi:MAG: Re/Si-specific NAD(P)(+) transhydrogenase subunit alpha [Phycisphaerae bacterium]|jgi:NAD(P) transhydrogenase subunit alpha|nr:Re/Si-specific NAD(P)(+) transhydrogenase subunit alpha [Phycisphaerae bacterium]